ncbi:sigma-70 family RNA polymerase sigma factor [Parabacteroides goldsteinii]|uniref:Sigma-70 family RNA polymerase sigma factor n=1 Tax=Parabacteroides goldsteinii CL02T12C30 TaxID=999418 RepID=K5Y7X7_9BACT|nr:sigma-70 family RNA polymerase sigma factor [Parabacteroides goldsteinii]EKN09297.1 sigma-70 family RNA polymerase sigma factor [Parabacteroides goldsteinii CL02T12C30]
MKEGKENEQAFLTLIQENRRLIYKVCYLYAIDEEHLKDLHQEVLINLWQGFKSFKGEAKISSWIYRVALNTCISFYRKHSKITGTMPLESLFELTSDDEEKPAHLREMYQLIGRLNRLEKAIILLWLDEKSYEEIAEITGLSRNNIATKLKRIKEKLNVLANQ